MLHTYTNVNKEENDVAYLPKENFDKCAHYSNWNSGYTELTQITHYLY